MNISNNISFASMMIVAVGVPIVALFTMPAWLLLIGAVSGAVVVITTRAGRQAWLLAWMGIETIPQRLGPAAVVVVGIAGVVAVLVALLAMGAGFEATFRQTGTDDTVIILSSGAQSESGSVIGLETAALVTQAPQVSKDSRGYPISSAEILVAAPLRKKGSGLPAVVAIRGIGATAWELRPQVKIVTGRKFKPGVNEVIVGRGVQRQFMDVDLNSKLTLNGQSWVVVGVFDSGDAFNSEIWTDVDVVASAFHRGGGITSITQRLTSADATGAFEASIASDPRLKVVTQTTRRYYNRQSQSLARVTRILGATVGTIMAIGALFGALNTMYATVATRWRELATLRALGFCRVPVIVSVLIESMFLAASGGLIGAAFAWLLFDGFTASTLGFNGQVMFEFSVSPALLWNGVQWALAIGFVGGLFPAVRAARAPITLGLRDA
jgi:putative ABC transport system permease protein